MIRTHNLPPYLAKVRNEIEGYAKDMGLSFFNTVYQIVDHEEMSSLAAYGGFPNRYPHWRFGMNYNHQRQTYKHGFGTIFEMVINNDPAYAYLLDCNNLVQQKLVMAHVFGHVDFFTNNYMFQHTNRKMMDKTANNATKVRRHVDKQGIDEVERFLDIVLSLEDLIDPTRPLMAEEPKKYDDEQQTAKLPVGREYMGSYINPREKLKKPAEDEQEKRKKRLKLITQPERDILSFLLKHAPLANWQKSILDIVREESYYFTPQWQTKILNEGWACYCHEQIMTKRCLDSSEIVDFADWHSRVLSSGDGFNPYAFGLALLRDVEDRWDRGRHGKAYDECDDMEARRTWNTHDNKGLEKLFEVRKYYNDITFIDEFLTQEFVTEHKFFTASKYDAKDCYEWIIDSKQVEDVKQELFLMLTNRGNPFIFVTDGNYQNKGELLMHHRWEGQLLDIGYACRTMSNLEKIWCRPVNLETFMIKEGDPGEIGWKRIRCENGKFIAVKMEDKDLSYKY